MTVESNYAIAIATLSDRFENVAPVYQIANEKGNQKQSRLARALSKLHGMFTNLDLLIAPFAPVVIGRSNYFGICFSILN